MAAPLKVLHLDSGKQMRGGQWQTLYLMVGQKTIGIEPRLLVRPGSPLEREAQQRGIPTGRLSLWSVANLSRKCDLTHAHDARSHTIAAIAAANRLVVARRVAFPLRQGFLSRWKYRNADLYLAVSEFVARQLIAAGVDAQKIRVVPDGVPVETKPQRHGDLLLAPRWDDPQKGDSLAREAGLMAGCSVKFSKFLVSDLPSARVLLYLTQTEGLGSAALLAMAHGVPVIASRVGGLPEIVRDGVNGILVENRVEDVAAAIRLLMNDPPLAAHLGEAGRQMILDGYTLAHMALRTYHEYKQVLA